MAFNMMEYDSLFWFALDPDRSMQCWWRGWSARSLRHYVMPQVPHNGHWKSLRCPDCCLTLSHIHRSYKSNKPVWRISSDKDDDICLRYGRLARGKAKLMFLLAKYLWMKYIAILELSICNYTVEEHGHYFPWLYLQHFPACFYWWPVMS